mmetsp:Transcript_43319/g.104960  ORF Transcript_43319/g.104960 Transcript_43319/m.104960 type:complete len:389 (+) Transcript_43319:260-1426(+)
MVMYRKIRSLATTRRLNKLKSEGIMVLLELVVLVHDSGGGVVLLNCQHRIVVRRTFPFFLPTVMSHTSLSVLFFPRFHLLHRLQHTALFNMSQASRSGKDNGRYHPPTNNQGYTIPKTLVFPNGMNAQVVIDRVMKNEEIVIKQQQNGLKSDADVKELALKGLLTSEQYGQYLDTICKRETFVREHVTYSNKMCSKFFDMNQVDQSPKKTPPPAGEVTGELPVDFANMESPSLHAPHVRSPIDSQKAAQDQFNDTKQNKLRRRQKSDLQIAKERSMDRSFQVAKERQLKSKKEEEARKKEQAEAKKMEQEKHHQTVKAALEKQKASAEPVSSGKTRVKRGVPSGPEVPNVARGVDLNNKRTDIPTGSNKKKRLTNFLNESMAAESSHR